MPDIHPTAILEGDINLAEDVSIGPNCVLTGDITLGSGTKLIGHVYLTGPITMGENNIVYPFSCLGFAPQHANFDPGTPGKGLVIGEGNTFREQVTIHRAFEDEKPTTIGDRNLFMVSSHAGHDCSIGNDCTFANNALLAGHVIIEDRVILGGSAVVHQHCRIGYGAILSGIVGTGFDLAPWFMLTAINFAGSINLVGLRRNGVSRSDIDDAKWAYKVICKQGLSLSLIKEELQTRADSPMIADYIRFVNVSTRGLCRARAKAARGTVPATEQEPAIH